MVLEIVTDPRCDKWVLLQEIRGLRHQGGSNRVIRFYVERRVLLQEILRIASIRKVQPSDSVLCRETGIVT